MPGLAARRNAAHLAPIQTSFKAKTVDTARHDSFVASQPTDEIKQTLVAEPSKPEPVAKPRKSRTSLFDLFSKPNVERSRGHREALPPMPALPAEHNPPSRQHSTRSKKNPRPRPPEEPSQALNSTPSRPQLKSSKSSKSLRTAAKKDDSSRLHAKAPWHPPPLFQAYPQALKHTSLEAPESSHSPPATTDRKSAIPSTDGSVTREASEAKTPRFFSWRKSRSRLRDDSVKAKAPAATATHAWARKVYVLVTAGYLLEYAGDGPFDRMPEKVLKLGPESAAFASDVIEGKHWVLEVLQTATVDDYSVQASPKTFLFKIGVRSQHGRRFSPKLLLVFPTPEEMDSWRVAIRREIDVDGKKPGVQVREAPSIKRYSSIIRQPDIDDDNRPHFDSACTSPTIVASQRASSTVIGSSSSTTFSSRYSRQLSPSQQFGDTRSLSAFFSGEEQMVIGPALKSPGFFERHRTPMTAEFPDSMWPGYLRDESPKNISGLLNGFGDEANPLSSSLERQRSLHSISSMSSVNGGETEGIEYKQNVPQLRQSVVHLGQRDDALVVNSASLLLSLPSPALPQFPEPPRRSAAAPAEMESIAESPPPSQQEERPLQSVGASAESMAGLKRLPNTRASASVTTRAPATSTPTSRTSKRNSVFARPIPIATPGQRPTDTTSGASSGRSSRSASMRETPPMSRRTSTYQDIPPSPTSNTASGRPSQENALRRPVSLQISTDHAPFLAPNRNSPKSPVFPTIPEDTQRSHRVPVLRAPSMNNGSRVWSSASHLHFPPPRPPPTMPLPAPPMASA